MIFGKSYLKHNSQSYLLDSKVLLKYITGLNDIEIFTKDNTIIEDYICEKYLHLLEKRKSGCPVQYIINQCEFMSLNFYVDENVLIPRPDTEILVEKAIAIIKENKYNKVLEIGTGSGCISVSLAKYIEDINITAVDISELAILVAKKNAVNNSVLNKIKFIQSDLFENINENNFDVIISNPPYIKKDVIPKLEPNVKDFEPNLALDGGVTGLDFYNKISKIGYNFLKPNGTLLFEIGNDQGITVPDILKFYKYKDVQVFKDYASFDRVVVSKK